MAVVTNGAKFTLSPLLSFLLEAKHFYVDLKFPACILMAVQVRQGTKFV